MSPMPTEPVTRVQYRRTVNRQDEMMRKMLNALRTLSRRGCPTPLKVLVMALKTGEGDALGTSERTIRRLINELKSLGAEITWERPRVNRPGGYLWHNRGWRPNVYSRGSLVHLEAFAFAARSFEDCLPPMIQETLQDFEACVNSKSDEIDAMVDHPATQALVSTAGCNVDINPTVAAIVIEAWRNCRPLTLKYKGGGCTMEPHALYYTEGAWYVRGRQTAPATKRTWQSYSLHRMAAPAHMGTGSFTRDEKILVEIRSGKLFNFETVKNVEICCQPSGEADYIKERRFFPGQTLTTNPDGSVTMRIPEVAIDHVVSWVLAFGQSVEVVQPPALRAKVREACERMLALHKD